MVDCDKMLFFVSILFCLQLTFALTNTNKVNIENGKCTKDMFSGDDAGHYAYWACMTENALQNNWFPSPIAGLFSYQAWNGFDGFWQNGAVLETMANFMEYANHTRYKTVVLGSLRSLDQLLLAYYPQPSYDDMCWYALSYLRIYQVFKDKRFLDIAKSIFDWNWKTGWDKSHNCSGGMWFDQGKNSKVTITNVQMLHVAAKLYRLTGSHNVTLHHQLQKIWTWIEKHHIINSTTYLLADGINLNNCTNNDNYNYTYSSGVLVGGLIHMSHIFSSSRYIDLAHRVANATITFKSVDGVLTEDCDLEYDCGDDSKVFKGIFVRNLHYLMDESNYTISKKYNKWLQKSAFSLLNQDNCTDVVKQNCTLVFQDGLPFYKLSGPVFDTSWHGPFNYSSPKPQASALDLLVSLIPAHVECKGPGCHFDPPTPPPRPMTCKDNPCPPGQDCCEYSGSYRTCCQPTQQCQYGFCE